MIRTEVLRKCSILLAIAALCLSAAPANAGQIDAPELGYYLQGGILANSPDYEWWYGCSPTSAGMMMGYYDINGYGGLYYDNLVAGGTAELSTFGAGPYRANDTIASAGHITDFYVSGYLGSGDDVAPPHHSFDSLADFMGTSQDSVGNVNGSTTFYYFTTGAPLHDYQIYAAGPSFYDSDGMYGIGEYATYASYGAANLYTQPTDNLGLLYGFAYKDYVAEIDAGRVVMLHIEGHSMFGYGYDVIAGVNTILLYDTWNPGLHTMAWGGAYSGLDMWGVTVFELTGGAVVPVPAAVVLGILGMAVAGWKLRRFA